MPWDPTRDLLTMQERLESLFGRAAPGWVPPADLVESAGQYILTVELPGLRREDIQIDCQEQTLTVAGHRPAQPICPERYEQLERGQGPFSRTFRFGSPVDPEGITATLADGVLTIVVPKREPTATQIPVR
jgi:HSP20 family protein